MKAKLIALACIFALAGASPFIVSAYHSSVAGRLVAAVREMRPGRTSQADVAKFERAFRWFEVANSGCAESACSYSFVIDNSWLSRLRMARPGYLGLTLITDAGKLQRSRLTFRFANHPDSSVEITDQLSGTPRVLPTGASTLITLTPESTEADRQNAYALRTELLSKLSPKAYHVFLQ